MKKRISCIVLSLLLVLCLVPATIMAEEGIPTESKVTSIEATIKPILGARIGKYGTNYADTHVKSFDHTPKDYENINLQLYATTWYVIQDADYKKYEDNIEEAKKLMKKVASEDLTFQDDYHYYVVVEFIDKYIFEKNGKKDYTCLPFAENVSGKINGKEVTVTRNAENNNKIISLEGYVDVSGIYKIDMEVTAPSLGKVADYKPTIQKVTDDVCEESFGLGVTSVEETIWYKVEKDAYIDAEADNWVEMEENEEYTTGYYYMARIDVRVTNNEKYYWLYRTLSKYLTGTLNGSEFDLIDVYEGLDSVLLFKVFEPLSEPVSEDTPIKSYDSRDTNQDGVVDCSEEMNSKDWIWSNTKGACVYKVSNTSVK